MCTVCIYKFVIKSTFLRDFVEIPNFYTKSTVSNPLRRYFHVKVDSDGPGVRMADKAPLETTFYQVDERIDFPKEEEKVLKYWDDIDAFKTSMKLSEGRPNFKFYDGPPFATGLPHYGHILAGTIKDVITRYAYQTGHHVERRFGWDCHGLPIEHEIDKSNNITHLSDVYEMGIGAYNELCRNVVMKYSTEWRCIIRRTGRWVDFDNDYKTMDIKYMETLWWIFKQLFDKGLVYRGFQVMPYSLSCSTPLSNFEANLNYKMVTDPSIFVSFRCVDEDYELVAWTTTPWTLPSNIVLCVNESFKYVMLRRFDKNVTFVVADCRIEYFCSETKLVLGEDLKILGYLMGKDLVGKRYEPLFDYFSKDTKFCQEQYDRSYFVIADNMVTSDAGTGIVHCAPYYGDEDMRVCRKHKIVTGELPDLLDESGYFKPTVDRLAGLYIKDADVEIKRILKEKSRLVHSGTIVHSYPYCWRSDTPLIYRAVSCWFIRIEDYREDILKSSERTNWIPNFIRDRRFHNWITDARDWCVSRNRFWGTPIPLWASEDYSQIVCIGSVEELEHYAGRKIIDLHRHYIDDITVPDPRGEGYPPLRRVSEIFDCWYESGSMPFAKSHYPFENATKLADLFPADFVAEGLDQTRGWFYTLMVISTYLFGEPAFQNVIVNGLVLAGDGKKMSKRLKNYVDPIEIINKYGADSVRLFLISSAAVKAEPLRFTTEGVHGVMKDVILPWFHSYRFLVQEVSRFEKNSGKKFAPDPNAPQSSSFIMDRWIHSVTQLLIEEVHGEMQKYKLYNVMPKLLDFLEKLNNWYIRINRDRMRGAFGEGESLVSLRSLYESLYSFTHLMSMFAPYTSEIIYSNLKRVTKGMASIHFEMLPKSMGNVDEGILNKIEMMRQIILLGRAVRERRKVALKFPVARMTIIHGSGSVLDSLSELHTLIKDELNLIDVDFSSDVSCICWSATPNFKALGARLGKDMKQVSNAIKSLSVEEIEALEEKGYTWILGHRISIEDVAISTSIDVKRLGNPNLDGDSNKNIAVVLDFTADHSLQRMANAREFVNRIQKVRKSLRLCVDDQISIHVQPVDPAAYEELASQADYISKGTRKPVLFVNKIEVDNVIYAETLEIGNQRFNVAISKEN